MYPTEINIQVLKEILDCCYCTHLETYDAELNPLTSDNEEPSFLHTLLLMQNTAPEIQAHCKTHETPVILNNFMELYWIAVPQKMDSILHRIHVVGPVFTGSTSFQMLESSLQKLQLSLPTKLQILKTLQALPIISVTQLGKIGQMLYYCVSGLKLSLGNITYAGVKEPLDMSDLSHPSYDHSANWIKEQTLLKLFHDGNMNYDQEMNHLQLSIQANAFANKESIRNIKNAVIVAVVLYSRASISGGLSPEIALPLADNYIKNVEECKSLAELAELNGLMIEDFIGRVHRSKSAAELSVPIKSCCEYIHMHLEDALEIKDIAAHVGYTEYYLSKKFKKETGIRINNYIKTARVERAKLLLKSPRLSIQEISERLHFCNASYFSAAFREVTGMAPTTYLEQ